MRNLAKIDRRIVNESGLYRTIMRKTALQAHSSRDSKGETKWKYQVHEDLFFAAKLIQEGLYTYGSLFLSIFHDATRISDPPLPSENDIRFVLCAKGWKSRARDYYLL